MTGTLFFSLLSLAILGSCHSNKTTTPANITLATNSENKIPVFNADSAFNFVKAQTDYGPRVPNTAAHKACAEYLTARLKSFGAKTTVQHIEVTTFDNTLIKGYNIIGQFNPDKEKRVIICAHWDSRPWADNDPDPQNHHIPVDGANDGASGIGVILEIARLISVQPPGIGIDCILFDAEDWGPGNDYQGDSRAEHWGLGTQFWSRNPHIKEYKANYAVLLDMVGGQGATFFREGFSKRYASDIVKKIWDTAHSLGYDQFFPQKDGGYVTDDHYFINTIAGIPAIDIVPYHPECSLSSFGPTWHTVNDNIGNIDRSTLKAVGQTLLNVLYNEK